MADDYEEAAIEEEYHESDMPLDENVCGEAQDGKRERNWMFYRYAEHADHADTCPYSDEAITWLNPANPCPLEYLLDSPKVKFLACQVEQGEEGPDRIHIQGYLQTINACTHAAMVKHFGERFWFKVRRGTHEEALAYVTKEKTRVRGPWIFGTPADERNKGRRTDWEEQSKEMAKRVSSGVSRTKAVAQAVLSVPHLATCTRGLEALYNAHAPEPVFEREVKLYYIWGRTSGAGKTTRTKRHFKFDAFYVDGSYVDGKSFDQYENQKVIVFDEWKDCGWPMTLMNGLLDPFAFTLVCRYYNKVAQWTTAIILSNCDPDKVYSMVPDRHTFMRRLENKITRIESWEDPLPFMTADEHADFLVPPVAHVDGGSPVDPANV